MKKNLSAILLVLAATFVASCNNDPYDPSNPDAYPCALNNWADVHVVNTFSDPYHIIVGNQNIISVAANSTQLILVKTGQHQAKFVQATGFILTPTTITSDLDVKMCETYTITLN